MLLDRDQGSASRARQWTKSQAADAGLGEEAVSVVELLVGELIANAVRHVPGGGEVNVETSSGPERFGVFVFDSSGAAPVMQRPTLDADHGRGLALVDALATGWGWTAMGPASKAVWFFLAAGQPPPSECSVARKGIARMGTTDETVRLAPTSQDGAVQVVRVDRDHVSVQLTSNSGAHDALAESKLLCGAVAGERARHTRHVQIGIDGAAPSSSAYLGAMRARVGTDVQSMTMRRAGSSVMVDLHLMPPAPEPGVDAAVEGTARPIGSSDRPRPVVGAHP